MYLAFSPNYKTLSEPKINHGKTTIEFESRVSVKQGDNHAPKLFLFMIEAAMENN